MRLRVVAYDSREWCCLVETGWVTHLTYLRDGVKTCIMVWPDARGTTESWA